MKKLSPPLQWIVGLTALFALAAIPASGQLLVNVDATPYFQSDYEVGLTACWDPVPGATSYRVTHFRQDACGSAAPVTTTTSLCSSSGAHPNCGAPSSCYFKRATVEALNSSGSVIATGSDSLCQVGQKIAIDVTPYFRPNYAVGLRADWEPVNGAASYRVTHFRQDACGSASITSTTTSTASASGTHVNCGAPSSCYLKRATVEALDSWGRVLGSDSGEICEVGVPGAVALE